MVYAEAAGIVAHYVVMKTPLVPATYSVVVIHLVVLFFNFYVALSIPIICNSDNIPKVEDNPMSALCQFEGLMPVLAKRATFIWFSETFFRL